MIKHPRDNSLHERKSENGFDHEATSNQAGYNSVHKKSFMERSLSMSGINSDELKGFGFLATGALLFVYTLGWFPMLNWVVMAASLFSIVYGASRMNLWDKLVSGYDYIKSLFAKSKKD